MKITYHGHSCFEIETGGYHLLTDPFLTGNPLSKTRPEDLKVDWIILTHGHNDHVGDAVAIARQNDATIIAPHELSVWLGWQGLKTHGMAVGGGCAFEFGHVKLVNALHGSGFTNDENRQIIYLGPATGFVLTAEGKTVYHAGDSGLFSDMKQIGKGKGIDLALLPIGDNYTMGPDDALVAAEWVRAKQVIPMHYNTFPLIEQDPREFVKRLAEKGIQGNVLEIGESTYL
ncbi:MAG: metal-dependent hydrolase [Thermoactinomyces sp.]